MRSRNRGALRIGVGVAGMYPASCACFIVNASLAFLGADLYPEVPYATLTLLLTVPSLIVVPATVISSLVADRVVSSRALACASLVLIAIAGSAPAMISGFWFALASRVLVGLGLGIVTPIFNRLPLELFPLRQATLVQGGGNALANMCGIAFQLAAAAFAQIDVSFVWLMHAVFIIPAIASYALIPDLPDKWEESEPCSSGDGEIGDWKSHDGAGGDCAREIRLRKPLVPRTAVVLAIAYGAIVMFYYPVMVNVGAIVLDGGLGGSSAVAVIGSMYNVGGILAGVLYSRLYYCLRRWFFPTMLAVWLAGIGAGAFSSTVAGYCIGTFLCGFGLYNVFPGSLAFLSLKISSSAFSLATSMFSAIANLAMFMSTPLLSLISLIFGSHDPRLPLAVGFVAVACIGFCYAFYMFHTGIPRYGERA